MSADPQYLRQHYASLSNEALQAINRADLVPAAQTCYDDEVRKRKQARPSIPELAGSGDADEDDEVYAEPSGDGEKPAWFDDAAEVFSQTDVPGQLPAPEVGNARDVLEAAGIPCFLDVVEIPEETSNLPPNTREWRVLVPGHLNQYAMSVLERDIFNDEFEAAWRTHLEMFSDQELRAMTPEIAFCGLFDRVERVTRAYDEELVRRHLKSESA